MNNQKKGAPLRKAIERDACRDPEAERERRREALREAYEERAAILQYDAPDCYRTRAAAEVAARRMTGYNGE